MEPGIEQEPLPGIPPLDSRVGLIFHDQSPQRNWAIEYSLRAVDRQNRIAFTLDEIETPGFVTMDLTADRTLRLEA